MLQVVHYERDHQVLLKGGSGGTMDAAYYKTLAGLTLTGGQANPYDPPEGTVRMLPPGSAVLDATGKSGAAACAAAAAVRAASKQVVRAAKGEEIMEASAATASAAARSRCTRGAQGMCKDSHQEEHGVVSLHHGTQPSPGVRHEAAAGSEARTGPSSSADSSSSGEEDAEGSDQHCSAGQEGGAVTKEARKVSSCS